MIKKNLDKVLLVGIALLFIVIGYFYNQNDNSEFLKITESEFEIEDKADNDNIIETKSEHNTFVQVSGCIVNEGVYEISSGDRLFNLVEMAGGLCDEVDYTRINLSMVLNDEMKIHIPKVGENIQTQNDEINVSSSKNADNNKVNINTADIRELTTLPGIGESKANAILDYRKKTKFNNVEDIKNISGIGDKSFEKLKDKITIN